MTFLDYLEKRFLATHRDVLDDELRDRFNAWLETLDVQDVIEMAEDLLSNK